MIYIGDENNVARNVKNIYIGGTDGLAHKVKAIYVGVNSIAKLVWQSMISAVTRFKSIVGGKDFRISQEYFYIDNFCSAYNTMPIVINDNSCYVLSGCRQNGSFIGSYVHKCTINNSGDITELTFTHATSDSSCFSFSRVGKYTVCTNGESINVTPDTPDGYYYNPSFYTHDICLNLHAISDTQAFGIAWDTSSNYVRVCLYTAPVTMDLGNILFTNASFPSLIHLTGNQYLLALGHDGACKVFPLQINSLTNVVIGNSVVIPDTFNYAKMYKIDDSHVMLKSSYNKYYPVCVNNNTATVGAECYPNIDSEILPIGGTTSFAFITDWATKACKIMYYKTDDNTITLSGTVYPASANTTSTNILPSYMCGVPIAKNKCLVLYSGTAYYASSYLLEFE